MKAILSPGEEPSYIGMYVNDYLRIPYQDLHCSTIWVETLTDHTIQSIEEVVLTEEGYEMYREGKSLPDYFNEIEKNYIQTRKTLK